MACDYILKEKSPHPKAHTYKNQVPKPKWGTSSVKQWQDIPEVKMGMEMTPMQRSVPRKLRRNVEFFSFLN